ncbi:MAG: hypothetical protein KME42_10415 [Tildeniella nuda ZEHNDER 1965/U140]|jgi:hypothetical protein|nr:hypothetical protein [Tildeniella nuda ZEHNDER 1965/U140]
MRLETEFRLCLQRQMLEQAWHTVTDRPDLQPLTSSTLPAIAPLTWVKLLQRPSAYSADEALLLCEAADHQWVAWIPDYGEIVLRREQFESL